MPGPSIISAAYATPHPGWIDSTAAFAGCLIFTGLGLIKAWEANPNVRLDVVPVDVVAERVISAGFGSELPAPGQPTPQTHSVLSARTVTAPSSRQDRCWCSNNCPTVIL